MKQIVMKKNKGNQKKNRNYKILELKTKVAGPDAKVIIKRVENFKKF